MPKLRVLILTNRWYSDGGVENFIEQLVSETGNKIAYTIGALITEVESSADCAKMGPLIPTRRIADMYAYGSTIEHAMRKGNFDIVHVQASNGSAFFLCHLAKKAGIGTRIVHSHNAGAETAVNPVKKTIGRLSSALFGRDATDLWACSKNAGKYMFDDRCFATFANGIDIGRFAFSSESRLRIRNSLGVSDSAFLLGSIGRISYQKNPLFQLRVFSELKKLLPEAVFCMIGSGDLEKDVSSEAQRLSLSGSLIRLARTSEPEAFYSAFDALLFAPVFEGLSFVGIEAQCSGLPIYGSEALPNELGITDLIRFDSLEDGSQVWASRIFKGIADYDTGSRDAYAKTLQLSGFGKSECFDRIADAYRKAEYRCQANSMF